MYSLLRSRSRLLPQMANAEQKEEFEKQFSEKLEEYKTTTIVSDELYDTIVDALMGWETLTKSQRHERAKAVMRGDDDEGANIAKSRVYGWVTAGFVVVDYVGQEPVLMQSVPLEKKAEKKAPAATAGASAAPVAAPAAAAAAAPAEAYDPEHTPTTVLREVLKVSEFFSALHAIHIAGQHCRSRSFKARVDEKCAAFIACASAYPSCVLG